MPSVAIYRKWVKRMRSKVATNQRVWELNPREYRFEYMSWVKKQKNWRTLTYEIITTTQMRFIVRNSRWWNEKEREREFDTYIGWTRCEEWKKILLLSSQWSFIIKSFVMMTQLSYGGYTIQYTNKQQETEMNEVGLF